LVKSESIKYSQLKKILKISTVFFSFREGKSVNLLNKISIKQEEKRNFEDR
jgi:hypothetical protein